MKAIDKSEIRKILVRSTNWLGDAVMTTPAIGAVRHSFPDAKITLLANSLVAQLFSPHDWVDEVMVYDKKGKHSGLAGKIRMAAELRECGFDLAILLQNAFDAALLAWLARIPRRMGYRTDGRGVLLTHGVSLDGRIKTLHHVEYYLEMLRRWEIDAAQNSLYLTVSPQEEQNLEAELARAGIASGDFVIGINPGAAYGSAKRWYPERFAKVAADLGSEWKAKIVITGGAGEAGMAADIESFLNGKCCNLVGKTSVRGLMSVIKRCNFFVTNDSGPMHIAAAFNVPLVAIFGSTDHRTTSPHSLNSIVVREETDCAPCLKRECPTDHRCMTAVTADAVIEVARALRRKTEG